MIQIIDPHRRLSRNPRHWPESLKEAIADCCCGSGSGSGRGFTPCCEGATPALFSWEITGTTGAAACVSGTEAPNAFGCEIDPDDLSGFRCGVQADQSSGYSYDAICHDGGLATTITISLCCVEPPPESTEPFSPHYRFAVYLQVSNGITAKLAQWCTETFDLGSCTPFHIELDNTAPLYDDFGGARLTMVIT